ncbi:FAD/NAD(P)-binding oxidoreductase [Propionigenium maris DSM 9537]|uniref:FAD/NAD(P)-binding oxidoreductase n=1 Tax=Propionigenium maris DSM 9537 TaxID=1123000 RepID=A0A9W6LP30_9FUSO|nr:NAD(P)/FAD-dependent oxidoreductase [Propionigenium maris]GLI57559.1 FAD/NAD(P)-binding oxidoreductase [Propionigenium maris DSM 9537]
MRDVVVVGGGIVGASVARELARFNLDVAVVERENDVSNGASKANSAIVHAGYDAEPGTLMAKYNVLGNAMFDKLSQELDVPFKRCGSLVVAFAEEERKHLKDLMERGMENGVPGLKLIDSEEARVLEPNLNPEVRGALLAESAGIVGPWELTIAMMENAVENGVELELNQEVIDIERIDEGYRIQTNQGYLDTRMVINAGGIYADRIHNMVAKPTYRIRPRRGQYFVMDKSQGRLVGRVIFQCPTELGKGVLVTPTVHGNLLLGPDAQDLTDREDHATTEERLTFVREQAVRSVAGIELRDVIRDFAGLRAESDRGDFVIEEAPDAPGFIDVGGIKSPGLTAAPAIGVDVARMVAERLDAQVNDEFNPERRQIVFMELSSEERRELIGRDPRYGRIICRCESITEGEIVASIHRKVGAITVDGVKKRCRPGMGRCQGGFCGPRVQEILARELHISLEDVVLDRRDSYILVGETK